MFLKGNSKVINCKRLVPHLIGKLMNDINENYYTKFLKILKKNGYCENDFSLESEDKTDYSCDGLNQPLLIILIKRKTTQIIKSYQLDQEVNWATQFEEDLKSRLFD